MSKGRTSPQESNPAAQPVFVMTAKGDSGGVGATTAAVIIIDLLHLAGHRVAVARLDSQERLDKFCGDLPMLRLETSLLERSRDGDDAVVRSLTPFYDDAIQRLQSGISYLLDQGATRSGDTLRFLRLCHADADFREIGAAAVVVVVYVSGPDSIRQSAETVRATRLALPSATIVLVENQRDGVLERMPPHSEAARAYADALLPVANGWVRAVLPRVPQASMHLLETSGLRPVELATLPIGDVMARSGMQRASARIAVGDIVAAVSRLSDGLGPVFGILPGT